VSDDEADEKALVPARPLPPLVLAKDLAAATPRTFVHVDRHGQVRSPARFRAIETATYGAIGVVAAGITITYGLAFGLPGVAIGLGVGFLLARSVGRVRTVQKAARLIVHDRVEEAEPILKELVARRRLARRVRALAEQNLAACAQRRGRFEDALAHLRAAIALYARGRRSPFAQAIEYGEVVNLVNLDRLREAREIFDRRHKVAPDGDYLRVHHWVTELYLAMAEGACTLDDDELHTRVRFALGLSSGAALLALLAWAEHARGDLDLAWHLLREACDRRGEVPLERTMPRLHAWIEANEANATETS
jgi:tetratricopeptide (TPR) repeat protein